MNPQAGGRHILLRVSHFSSCRKSGCYCYLAVNPFPNDSHDLFRQNSAFLYTRIAIQVHSRDVVGGSQGHTIVVIIPDVFDADDVCDRKGGTDTYIPYVTSSDEDGRPDRMTSTQTVV